MLWSSQGKISLAPDEVPESCSLRLSSISILCSALSLPAAPYVNRNNTNINHLPIGFIRNKRSHHSYPCAKSAEGIKQISHCYSRVDRSREKPRRNADLSRQRVVPRGTGGRVLSSPSPILALFIHLYPQDALGRSAVRVCYPVASSTRYIEQPLATCGIRNLKWTTFNVEHHPVYNGFQFGTLFDQANCKT